MSDAANSVTWDILYRSLVRFSRRRRLARVAIVT